MNNEILNIHFFNNFFKCCCQLIPLPSTVLKIKMEIFWNLIEVEYDRELKFKTDKCEVEVIKTKIKIINAHNLTAKKSI